MRKFTFIIFMMLSFAVISMAQTVENFESIKMNTFDVGANGMAGMAPNPDPTGINTSLYVGKMVRGMDGQPWAGWYAPIATAADLTANKYVHIKVWKPRLSPVVFKYEAGAGANSGDVYPIADQTMVGGWEELVFDFSALSGEYKQIVLIPDFETPLTLTEDITLYFDDIYANNDPAVGSAPVQMLENFEPITMNYMGGGAEDLSTLTVITNPDKSGVNLSESVVEFKRDKDGVPWGGFWSSLPTPVDVTTNKFVHVKVWKSRISPVKFKIEGGAAGTIEKASKYAQTKTREWEDIVFDFREKTGTYPIVALMPDFEDPLTLTADDTLYFDDIIVNNDSIPMTPPMQVISVDMSSSPLPDGQKLYLAGALSGIYGSWNEPGTNPNNEMFDTDGDGIYSITLYLPDGPYTFKFFKGAGWGGGDTAPGGDRTYTFEGNANLLYMFGVQGLFEPTMDNVNLIKDGHFATDGPIASPWGTWSGNGGTAEIVNGVCVMTPGAAADNWQLQVNQLGNDNGWAVVNGTTYLFQFDAKAETDRVFSIDFEDPNNSYKRFGLSPDEDAVNGESQWDVALTTEMVTYTRTVTFNEVKDNTNFLMNIMPSAHIALVYIDNIYLIPVKYMSYIGTAVESLTVIGEGDATTIETAQGTLQMMADALPVDASFKGVSWSVMNGTGKALIDANGVLTALKDGTVTVKAVAQDGSRATASLEITISNQVKSDLPIGFERIEDIAWDVFANGAGKASDFQIVANPAKTGINTSDNALKFVVNAGADPWAGAFSDIYTPVAFTEEFHTVAMMVFKSIVSPSGFKVEASSDGGPVTEVKVSNTVVDEWEVLQFDMSACIGHSYSRVVIFPDFPATRTEGTTVYLDNISLINVTGVSSNLVNSVKIYPNPVTDELNVFLNSPDANVAIYNSMGRLMRKVNVKGLHARIDVSNFAKGVYFVKVNNDAVVKFIK